MNLTIMNKEKIEQAAREHFRSIAREKTGNVEPTSYDRIFPLFSSENIMHAFVAGAECGMKEIIREEPWNEVIEYSLQNQWINVKDEIPIPYQSVLCRMKSNGAIVSGYITTPNGIPRVCTSPDFHFEDYGDYEPTHWMPIPQLPTENK